MPEARPRRGAAGLWIKLGRIRANRVGSSSMGSWGASLLVLDCREASPLDVSCQEGY